jgi:hypothetical protein
MKQKNDNSEKLSLLTQLIKMARVDQEIREDEFQFLSAIAAQIGVSSAEFEKLFEEYIDFQPPIFEFDRIVQLHRLVLLMNVDKEIDEKEILYIKSLGIKLGLNPLAVAEVLDTMTNYPNNLIPPEKLISIFRTFHN